MTSVARMPLDWSFDAVLQDRQTALIQALKPGVIEWATQARPLLLRNLRNDPVAGCSTATDLYEVEAHGVWIFLATFVNRDIGEDMVAMVAASASTAELMAKAFMQVMQARLGGNTK